MSCCCFFTVEEQTVGIVQRFGKFTQIAEPGLGCFLWPIDQVAAHISRRVESLNINCETKTKDDVFVLAQIMVQYMIVDPKTMYYNMTDVQSQLKAYIYDVARSSIPLLDLDETFLNKDKVSNDILTSLSQVMSGYGIKIIQALITDIEPDARVKAAMNEINASKRWIQAATNKAEGDKYMMVKAAEAEATAKFLSGQGVARQRAALVAGLRDSIHDFSSTVSGTNATDVMELLLMTQYFDMIKDIGTHSEVKAIFVNGNKDPVSKGVMEANMIR